MTHIFLYGPPGTGKSTIGTLLGQKLDLPFVDLDGVIESKTGMSISQIMEEQGEPYFRDLETTAIKEVTLDREDKVIALGGGALLREENRAIAESCGRIVLLMAEMGTLIPRLGEDPIKRPLLSGDLKTKLSALLEKRHVHYASFPVQFHVDGRTAEENAYRIQTALGRHHLSAMGEYDAIVGHISDLKDFPMQNPTIVTDENVAKLHLEKVTSLLSGTGHEPKSIVLPAGEEHKTLESISCIWRSFLENGLDRKSTVIALGGGVIGDMAGFAASTYMRGLHWIAVPTTLLSMVDASLGGKTGFDLPEGKNLIGSFYPPRLVLADPDLLSTLPERELRSGMAEVVKHGIISDPDLFDICSRGLDWINAHLEEVVKRAMAVKVKIIEEDPYEKGFRAALNLGHTVGHAVELVSGFQLRHGEAISIGMVCEAKYAERIGVAKAGVVDLMSGVLMNLGLPVEIPDELPREDIIRSMRVDKKKNSNNIRFALPVEIGKVELVDVGDLGSVLE